jgi:hypothetical protein
MGVIRQQTAGFGNWQMDGEGPKRGRELPPVEPPLNGSYSTSNPKNRQSAVGPYPALQSDQTDD